ncbi:MAG: hypothetical protein P1V35_02655 [Planctomycetota bacterium]|nr:hypothetical protein [Planctomycetota bacterium]
MKPIAFLTSADLLPGHPNRREDAWEFDVQFAALEKGCVEQGLRLEPAVWRTPEFRAEDYSAVFLGTAWDYALAPEEFLQALERIQEVCPLLNPLETVRWNMDKSYLRDLSERGVSVVPTLWLPDAQEATVAPAFDDLDCDTVVVKPLVGANAWRQVKVQRGQAWPAASELPPGECMVQPFLPAAMEEGELSLVFFDRKFSHSVLKVAAPGEYRIQSSYGGKELDYPVNAQELAFAQAAVDDMMRGSEGQWLLMELELIEPFLYANQGPNMGRLFADALVRLLPSPA